MANRHRPVQIICRVTPEERAEVDKRMAQAGTNNMSAYIRKMILDGYIVKLEFPELRDYVSLQRRVSNNLNQLVRRVNSTGRLYDSDILEAKELINTLWNEHSKVIEKLASIN